MRPANFALSLLLASLAATSEASTHPDVLAHEYAGLPAANSTAAALPVEGWKKPAKPQFSPAKAAWDSYEKFIGKPLRKWTAEEVAPPAGGTVFYPFSGPDFVTVAQMYPEAERYILVAIQPAGEVVDTHTMPPAAAAAFKAKFNAEWIKFGYLGFFRTLDLNENTASTRGRLTSTPVMMAFAAALGFRVESVVPLQFNENTSEFDPVEESNAKKWTSVRLDLSKDGRKVTLDYVSMDLSDSFLKSHPPELAWVRKAAAHPTLLKAASHLLPKPYFSACRAAVVDAAPLLIQDETGLEYGDLKKMGTVTLYGRFAGVFRLFNQSSQRELAAAYLQAGQRGVLPFAFSYQKSASQRSLQVVRREPRP
jgi:hypothetical protein